MDIEHQKKIDRIAKLLALSTSPNQNEARTAKEKAQELIKKYNLTQGEVAGIKEVRYKTNTIILKEYEGILADTVARALQCHLVVSSRWGEKTQFVFIGIQHKTENAKYLFTVLLRMLNAARKNFLKTIPKQTKPKNKKKRAESFCFGWVYGIESAITNFGKHNQEEEELITNHINETRKIKEIKSKFKLNSKIEASYFAGWQNAKKQNVRHGVKNKNVKKIGK